MQRDAPSAWQGGGPVPLFAALGAALLLANALHGQTDRNFGAQRIRGAQLLTAHLHEASHRFLELVQVQASPTLVQVAAYMGDIVVVELAIDVGVQRLQAIPTVNHRAPPVVLASTPLVV